VKGRAAINTLIAGVQNRFPGFMFRLVEPVDAHHETARFAWTLGPEGEGSTPIVGFDVIAAEDGRLRAVYGFLDKVPQQL